MRSHLICAGLLVAAACSNDPVTTGGATAGTTSTGGTAGTTSTTSTGGTTGTTGTTSTGGTTGTTSTTSTGGTTGTTSTTSTGGTTTGIGKVIWGATTGTTGGTACLPLLPGVPGLEMGPVIPGTVVAADFNGDGFTDIGLSFGDFRIFVNDGNARFTSTTLFDLAAPTLALQVGDFNEDGKPDIVAAAVDGNYVTVTLNGDDAGSNFPTGAGPSGIAVDDVNGDGHLDVVFANANALYLSILAGDGHGNLSSAANVTVPAGASNVATGDLDHDGIIDLVVTHSSLNQVTTLAGQGNNTFTITQQLGWLPDNYPDGLVLGDLNGDDHLDLVVIGGRVGAALGNGNATFQSPVTIPGWADSSPPILTDVNHDTKLDLITSDASDGSTSVYLGDGNGGFGPATVTMEGLTRDGQVAGDFNGDSNIDLVAIISGGARVLLGNGNTLFGPPIPTYELYPAEVTPTDAAVAYVNGDGFADIVIVSADGNILTLPGEPNGLFGTPIVSAAPGFTRIGAGDFNSDGHIDIAGINAPNESIGVMFGAGDGTFQSPVDYGTEASAVDLAVADINNDTVLDFIVANGADGNLRVLLGNPNGSFQNPLFVAFTGSPNAIVTGLFDSDTNVDLAVLDNLNDNVAILLGNGDGTFQNALSTDVAPNLLALTAADFNGDSYLDLAVLAADPTGGDGGGTSAYTTVYTLLGSGDGSLQRLIPGVLGYRQGTLTSGDLNGDGNIDLLGISSPGVGTFFGKGDGTFYDQNIYPLGGYGFGTRTISYDFNSDNLLDIAAVSGEPSILLNQGCMP